MRNTVKKKTLLSFSGGYFCPCYPVTETKIKYIRLTILKGIFAQKSFLVGSGFDSKCDHTFSIKNNCMTVCCRLGFIIRAVLKNVHQPVSSYSFIHHLMAVLGSSWKNLSADISVWSAPGKIKNTCTEVSHTQSKIILSASYVSVFLTGMPSPLSMGRDWSALLQVNEEFIFSLYSPSKWRCAGWLNNYKMMAAAYRSRSASNNKAMHIDSTRQWEGTRGNGTA